MSVTPAAVVPAGKGLLPTQESEVWVYTTTPVQPWAATRVGWAAFGVGERIWRTPVNESAYGPGLNSRLFTAGLVAFRKAK